MRIIISEEKHNADPNPQYLEQSKENTIITHVHRRIVVAKDKILEAGNFIPINAELLRISAALNYCYKSNKEKI